MFTQNQNGTVWFFFLPRKGGDSAMMDYRAKLEHFETLAADCDLICKLATDASKRELYLRLALHYRELAADLRKVIAAKNAA
jgi:hypothetical protein